MDNKSKLNTVLLVVIIILLAIGLGYFFLGNSKQKEDNLPHKNPKFIPETNNAWIINSKIGLTYSPSWELSPESYNTPAEEEKGEPGKIVGYSFTLPDGSIINWGGPQSTCEQDDFEKFQYGISVISCINGVRSNIGLSDVRSTLSKEDLNSFGDFVVKNQGKDIRNIINYAYSSNTYGYSIAYSGINADQVYIEGDGRAVRLFPNQSQIDTLEVVDSSYKIPNYFLQKGIVTFGENQYQKFKDNISSRNTYYFKSGLKNNKAVLITIENDSDFPSYFDLDSLAIQ